MKKTALVAAALVMFLLVFWVGFVLNFPGAALSRAIESRINAVPNLQVRLSPAALGWTGLEIASFQLSVVQPGLPQPLIVLQDVRIPIAWGLLSGLPVRARLGKEGQLDLFIPWEEGELRVGGSGLRLEEIPALTRISPARLRGGVSFSGQMQLSNGVRQGRLTQLPPGSLSARADGVELSNMEIIGARLPVTRLESIQMDLKIGKRLVVEQFAFQGDLQGKVSGFVQPRLKAIKSSPLQLNLAISFRKQWLDKLGPMRQIVTSFLKNGRLEGVVRGTLANPSLRPAGRAK